MIKEKVLKSARFYFWSIAVILLFCLPANLFAADFYVAPSGNSSGDGSKSLPWDIKTALSHPATIKPGDTIWLRGGDYLNVGQVTSTLVGTADNRISIKSYPGEWAKIDLYNGPDTSRFDHFNLEGQYTDLIDVEIYDSDPRYRLSLQTSKFTDIYRGTVMLQGKANRIINSVVHDTRTGITAFSQGQGGLVYGCITYNNGYLSTDVGRGHGIYTNTRDNPRLTKSFRDNLVFNNHIQGISVYNGHETQFLQNLELIGNFIFHNGMAAGAGLGHNDIGIAGWPTSAKNITVRENFTYQSQGGSVYLGATWGASDNSNLTIENNYFYSGGTSFWQNWIGISSSGNQTDYLRLTGYEPEGFTVVPTPSGTKIEVRLNEFETGRAHVGIYNWDKLNSIPVDLSSVLSLGASYEIYHAYNLNTPVASGKYRGGGVIIPMVDTLPQPLLGDLSFRAESNLQYGAPVALPKTFGAFLVKTIGGTSSEDTTAPKAPGSLRLE